MTHLAQSGLVKLILSGKSLAVAWELIIIALDAPTQYHICMLENSIVHCPTCSLLVFAVIVLLKVGIQGYVKFICIHKVNNSGGGIYRKY